MRRIPDNAECAEVLIGSLRNLSRPIMAFVRLSQGQLFGKIIFIFFFFLHHFVVLFKKI